MRGGLECLMLSHSVFASNRNSCKIAFGSLRVSSACFVADPSVSLCDEASVDGYVHIADEVLRSLIVCMDEGERDHYMFLYAALTKCERCLALWLHVMVPISVAAQRVIRIGSPQSQSGNLEIADTFSVAVSPAARLLRAGGVGHVRARATTTMNTKRPRKSMMWPKQVDWQSNYYT